jgi:NAD(P)-dependent dehydrogenase (short-subunit alcohol dehydrogenase family)
MIYFARQLVKRKLPAGPNTILVTSVHPGTVDTDIQEGPAQSYGVLGKVLDNFTRLIGKSAPEGAEASLWAATSTDINVSNYTEFQGNYYKEAYGTPGTETDLAKDEKIAEAFWTFSSERAKAILGEDVDVV